MYIPKLRRISDVIKEMKAQDPDTYLVVFLARTVQERQNHYA